MEKQTWQEQEAQYFLNYLESWMHENKDAKTLPDGPWASACMELDDICSAYEDGEISESTLKRKDRVFNWIRNFPKTIAEEVHRDAEIKDLMEGFSEMTPEQLRQYYRAMADDMEKELSTYSDNDEPTD